MAELELTYTGRSIEFVELLGYGGNFAGRADGTAEVITRFKIFQTQIFGGFESL